LAPVGLFIQEVRQAEKLPAGAGDGKMATANLYVDWGWCSNPPVQSTTQIPISVGQATAYDLFFASQVAPPLNVQTQGSGASIYVTGINGLIDNQSGNGYWWLYLINNQEAQVGCNTYLVQDGDTIAWVYLHYNSGLAQPNHPERLTRRAAAAKKPRRK
jgi:hypothetical protein